MILFQIYPSVIINELVSSKKYRLASAPIEDSRGFRGGSLEPPFESQLFHFHGEFSEKLGMNNKYSGKINKSNSLWKISTPLSRNPGSAPGRLRSGCASVQFDQPSKGKVIFRRTSTKWWNSDYVVLIKRCVFFLIKALS